VGTNGSLEAADWVDDADCVDDRADELPPTLLADTRELAAADRGCELLLGAEPCDERLLLDELGRLEGDTLLPEDRELEDCEDAWAELLLPPLLRDELDETAEDDELLLSELEVEELEVELELPGQTRHGNSAMFWHVRPSLLQNSVPPSLQASMPWQLPAGALDELPQGTRDCTLEAEEEDELCDEPDERESELEADEPQGTEACELLRLLEELAVGVWPCEEPDLELVEDVEDKADERELAPAFEDNDPDGALLLREEAEPVAPVAPAHWMQGICVVLMHCVKFCDWQKAKPPLPQGLPAQAGFDARELLAPDERELAEDCELPLRDEAEDELPLRGEPEDACPERELLDTLPAVRLPKLPAEEDETQGTAQSQVEPLPARLAGGLAQAWP